MKNNRWICIWMSLLLIAFLPLVASAKEAKVDSTKGQALGSVLKFRRGLINLGFGWTELFSSLNYSSNPTATVTNGVQNFLYRTGAGIYEIVTFPIPPYEPVLRPASPFERFPEVEE